MTTEKLTKENCLIVIPAFNEENTISSVVASLLQRKFNALVVSDGSTDNTAQIARENGALVLDLCVNLGVGGALRAGFLYAVKNKFEAVIQVDADGQHPVEQIDELIELANISGADLVLGSRFLSSDAGMAVSTLRKAAMRVLAKSASNATNSKITDSTSGFRLIRGNLLNQFSRTFPTNYLGDTYEALVAAGRAGFKVIEVPATMSERGYGDSTASRGQAVKFILKSLSVVALRLHPQIRQKS